MSDPKLDFFSVLSMLLAVSVGPQFAPALAAYIIILIGSMIGSLVALKMRPPTDKSTNALMFVIVLTAWSFGVTFGASLLIQQYSGIGWQWLLFPVSIGISSFGERWLQAPRMVWRILWDLIGKAAPKGGQQ